MAGLTAQGFDRLRLEEVKTALEEGLKQRLGAGIDLNREESVYSQLVGVFAAPVAQLWELAEHVYLSQSPDFATGVQLDEVAALNGITRIPATSTKTIGVVFGDNGVLIPAGSQARNFNNGDIYNSDTDVTIDVNTALYVEVSVTTVVDAATYTVTIDGVDYSITSAANSTATSIANQLRTFIAGAAAPVAIGTSGSVVNILVLPFGPGVPFAVTSNLTLSNIGNSVGFTAVETGQKNLTLDALNQIVTPVAGWRGVRNPYSNDIGTERESDIELRQRRLLSVAAAAQGTADALFSKISDIQDVDDVRFYENNTDSTDANGVPANSIYVVVRGGADADIGRVIFNNSAAGVGTFGNVAVSVNADNGQTYTRNFQRPTEITLYIDLDISTQPNFPSDGQDQIKNELVQYIANNLKISDNLVYSKLYVPVHDVPGVEINSLFVDVTATPTAEANVVAGLDEILVLAENNINITVT